MRNSNLLPYALLVVAGCATPASAPQPVSESPARSALKPLTCERIFAEPDLSGARFRPITWLPDGSGYVHVQRGERTAANAPPPPSSLVRVDAATGERTTWVSGDAFAKAFGKIEGRRHPSGRPGLDDFTMLPDGRRLLFENSGDLWLYDVDAAATRRLTQTEEVESDAAPSPDGTRVAFVRNFDVWTIDLATGAETRLTTGGTKDHSHGLSDWVYDEELGIHTGFWWSPDGKRIAFLDMDETPVPRTPLVDFLPVHQTVEWERYPKAGDPNPVVRVGVVAASGGPATWVDTPGAAEGYVARVDWTPDGAAVLVQILDRRQDQLTLRRADPATGASSVLFEETSTAWVDVNDDLRVLRDGRILWRSARTGFEHLWLFAADGTSPRQITSGAWNVDGVAGVDESAGFVYFVAGESGPRESQAYRVRLDGTGLERLTQEPGVHRVSMAPNAKTFVDAWSCETQPRRRDLRRADGSLVTTTDADTCAELAGYRRADAEFVDFRTSDGVTLHGQWLKPRDFDPSRRYPVLIDVYGGPLARKVGDEWTNGTRLWEEMLADEGVLVFSMDNRAASSYGAGSAKTIYGRLGTVELSDELEAVSYLRSQPFVDGARLAIWGWSYGGYMAAYSIVNAPGAFRAAVAVAPVTDWRNYDTIYTERYMGLPKDNEAGYAKSSVVAAAAKLEGRLMLVHGTGDDNVHVQNTMQLADALEKAGKQFRLLTYPGRKHGIGGGADHRHLFEAITEFLRDALDVPRR